MLQQILLNYNQPTKYDPDTFQNVVPFAQIALTPNCILGELKSNKNSQLHLVIILFIFHVKLYFPHLV